MNYFLKAMCFTAFLVAGVMGQDNPARSGTVAPTCMPGDHLAVQNGNYICVEGNIPMPTTTPTIGQTSREVEALLGTPGGVGMFSAAKGNFVWYYNHETATGLRLTFRNNKLEKTATGTEAASLVEPEVASTKNERQPGKVSRGLAIALGIATQIAFAHMCPQVYRKPLLFMNASDLQWLPSV